MNRLAIHDVDNGAQQQRMIHSRCIHPSESFVEFKKDAVEQSTPARFEEQAKKYPQRLAVASHDNELTYEMLNRAANRVAHAILRRQGAEREPIAILLKEGVSTTIAILGALKAGKAFVPLDSRYPKHRMHTILNDSQVDLVVTNNETVQMASRLDWDSRRVLNIDEIEADTPTSNPGLDISPATPCCIYYTSGSTGKPKGIVHSHRNVLHSIMSYTNSFHICADDRLALLHTYSFSASLIDIFSALFNGGAVLTWDYNEQGITGFAVWLIRQRITVFHWVPTPFRHFAQTLTSEHAFPTLRLIVLGSETTMNKDVELYKRCFAPHCIFANRLASTEVFAFRIFYLDKDTNVAGSAVPVGYAVDDKRVLLLDSDGKEVGEGEVGEIAVRSDYISMGYWRNSNLTRAALSLASDGRGQIFRTGDLGRLLPDGCLLHLGRTDFQVNIRGYRVETFEIEAVLHEHPLIREAVVIAQEDVKGDTRLFAYVVPHDGPEHAFRGLSAFLKKKLPDYMLPSAFIPLDALPLTPRGKLDRSALPDPVANRLALENEFVEARTPVEETIARIWSEVLGLDQVGIHDSFFELGGDSLLGTQLIFHMCNTFQVNLSLRELAEMPTVASLALCVAQKKSAQVDDKVLMQVLAELEGLPDDDVQSMLSTER